MLLTKIDKPFSFSELHSSGSSSEANLRDCPIFPIDPEPTPRIGGHIEPRYCVSCESVSQSSRKLIRNRPMRMVCMDGW